MKATLKKIPKFKNEEEESAFWQTHDSADFVDYSRARKVSFPNLKPSNRSVSIRMPEGLLNQLKIRANERGIPYQSLIKQYLYERVYPDQKVGHGG